MQQKGFGNGKHMKILLITSYFPAFDIDYPDPRTKFLYYYSAEWVKQGHEVLVLHSVPRFPYFLSKIIYSVGTRLGIKSTQLTRLRQNRQVVQSASYSFAGIKIIRNHILKCIPHRDFFSFELRRHKAKVLKSFKDAGFQPDIIISDFLTPSAYIASDIKETSGLSFYQILHQSDFDYIKNKDSKLCKVLYQAEGFLFRSYPHSKLFEQKGFSVPHKDYVFTGVPNDTLLGNSRCQIKKILFVGSLFSTKNIHIILHAIADCQNTSRYKLEIIGDGPYEKELKLLVDKLGLESKVVFEGRLPRDEVFKKMLGADCLVMVSKERYGMVYVEAMSQGCIVVAAQKQGIDGVVVNNENGFLVEEGNVQELAKLLDQLALLDSSEVKRISNNAIKTANNMKDGELAKSLLERLVAHKAAYK